MNKPPELPEPVYYNPVTGELIVTVDEDRIIPQEEHPKLTELIRQLGGGGGIDPKQGEQATIIPLESIIEALRAAALGTITNMSAAEQFPIRTRAAMQLLLDATPGEEAERAQNWTDKLSNYKVEPQDIDELGSMTEVELLHAQTLLHEKGHRLSVVKNIAVGVIQSYALAEMAHATFHDALNPNNSLRIRKGRHIPVTRDGFPDSIQEYSQTLWGIHKQHTEKQEEIHPYVGSMGKLALQTAIGIHENLNRIAVTFNTRFPHRQIDTPGRSGDKATNLSTDIQTIADAGYYFNTESALRPIIGASLAFESKYPDRRPQEIAALILSNLDFLASFVDATGMRSPYPTRDASVFADWIREHRDLPMSISQEDDLFFESFEQSRQGQCPMQYSLVSDSLAAKTNRYYRKLSTQLRTPDLTTVAPSINNGRLYMAFGVQTALATGVIGNCQTLLSE